MVVDHTPLFRLIAIIIVDLALGAESQGNVGLIVVTHISHAVRSRAQAHATRRPPMIRTW